MANPPNEKPGSWRWFKSFQYDKNKDSPSDARNVLLVVAALITAVTFQAGVNPPGGVWQDTKDGHTAGRAIYAAHQTAFYVFLISNTLALSSAIMVIISLTYRFPFHFEVWFATVSMIITYGSAVFAVTPKESVRFRYILTAAAGPFLGRLLWEAFNRWGGTILKFFRSIRSTFKSVWGK
ncbi:PGG domain containing protein [Trema orientale]|uniref:PGG domain containing protein n=1 Tax=Trema orientale TaxID=63057 RepID=A0A2P5FPM5_TREOI|nr:PGG domain containing protein [Trema orientale]